VDAKLLHRNAIRLTYLITIGAHSGQLHLTSSADRPLDMRRDRLPIVGKPAARFGE
jgi:hypothetical protein